jgi:hypothetical protein
VSVRLWLHPAILAEYAQNARIRLRRQRRGHTRRGTDAASIIRSGIDATWNGRSFTASPGHFHNFWVRDMAFSSTSLAQTSPEDLARLHASLAWALGVWERRGSHVTTTIHAWEMPADVYDYGVDSLPLLVAALRAADATDLVLRHRAWLEAEVIHFFATVVDPATGLVRSDRKFSAHRDTVTNRSNAYGNSMVALLARTLAETGWTANPMEPYFEGDYGRLLMEHFWDGDHFRDALGEDRSSGEANVWPFWTGVVQDPDAMAAAFSYLQREGYCDPYPLRYEVTRRPELEVWLTRHLLPDYQGSTVWTSIGAMYLQLLREVDPARAEADIERYREWIERDGTYWEVMNGDGTCWVSPRWVLIGEEAMLWGAIFLDILQRPEGPAARLSPAFERAPAVEVVASGADEEPELAATA